MRDTRVPARRHEVIMPVPLPASLSWIEGTPSPAPGREQAVWQDTDFNVMIVGGPNTRKDYHRSRGGVLLPAQAVQGHEDGKPRDVTIREGESSSSPGFRIAAAITDTVGLVIERRAGRRVMKLRWYCEACGEVLTTSPSTALESQHAAQTRHREVPRRCFARTCSTAER
jgi:3-hydroxyanthranilate 3,4-dioxygenase